MVLGTVFLFVVFVAARFGLIRAKVPSTTANIVAGGFVVLFLAGSLARPFGFPDSGASTVATASSPGADAAQSAAPVSFPPPAEVSSVCASASVKEHKKYGYLDGLTDSQTQQAITSGEAVPRKTTIVAHGWAIDPVVREPAAAVCVAVDGKIFTRAKAVYGYLRPDVGTSLADDKLTPTGFLVTIPGNSLPAGRHKIEAAVRSHNGSYVIIDNGFDVAVR